MAPSNVSRHLAAILAADASSYSRMMGEDEERTLEALRIRKATIAEIAVEHGGRTFGTFADSAMMEFRSPIQAIRAAVAIQRAVERRNADLPHTERMEFRIGVTLGDVMEEGDNLYGDAVNVAARLQEVASPGGICISGFVRDAMRGKDEFPIAPLGLKSLKNIAEPVAVHRVDWRLPEAEASLVSGRSPAVPDKPSIAVLPFSNMSGDPEQEYFGEGITEDIITALARHRWFFVIARNSSFVYKGRAVDARQIGRELGVRYVLEGSVRKAGNRLRVTAQLIECDNAAHLWAEHYDRVVADVFAIQDEITHSVVAAIEPEMLRSEGARAAGRGPASLAAYDCWMRAQWLFHKFERGYSLDAESWADRAISLDPALVHGHMVLGRILFARIWWGWSVDIERDRSKAVEAASRAVSLDDRDPYAHYALFLVSLLTRHHHEALAEAQRAIDLTPNFHLGYFALGFVRTYVGAFEEALQAMLLSLRLDPNESQSFAFRGQVALAHYHLGQYDEAIRQAQQALRGRRMYFALRTMVACLGQLGRIAEAAPLINEMVTTSPAQPRLYWQVTNPYVDEAHGVEILEGLRKAGMRTDDFAS